MTTNLTSADVDTVSRLDATGQAALVRTNQITAEELVTSAIERIERINPTLNAVITTAFEQALAAVSDGLPDGPFTGVPFLLKDLIVEAAGIRFCEGSAYLRDNVSTRDSELVRRYRRAGLVILGKTNTPEFGMAPTAEPRLFGATANPWDTSRTTGGSSGGSAAAVSSGMVPMAVRDSAALLDATSGPDLGDPYPAPTSLGPFRDEVGLAPGRLRIAYTTAAAEGRAVDPACVAAVEDAVQLCTELGHDVIERDLTELTPEVGSAIGTGYGAAITWIVDYWARSLGREPGPDDLEPLTRAYYEHGRSVSGGAYLMAVTTLQAFSRRIAHAFDDFDVWLSPTLAEPPPRLGELVSTDADPLRGEKRGADFVAIALVVANITGAPAMSVPLYWSPSGLPIGVHFMAPYGDEATLFRLAGQLEEARPWVDYWPSIV
jgi:amidase